MAVPYTFANQIGPIPLSELDENFAAIPQRANTANTVINSAQGNITSVGTLVSLGVTGAITSGNTITAAGNLTTSANAVASGLYINGSGIVTGNLQILGTLTSVNTANITTGNLNIQLGNSTGSPAALDGAGILVGSGSTATWLYNNLSASWQTNIGITPQANALLDLGTSTNYWRDFFARSATINGNIDCGNLAATVMSGISISVSGNVTGGNVVVDADVVANGNISSAIVNATNFTGGAVSVTGTVQAANLVSGNLTISSIVATNIAASVVSATGNIAGGNLRSTGIVTATGNITGGNIVTAGAITATGNITATANIAGGNIRTTGGITATGNITGSYILGNGSQLTGIDATSIQNGTSNVRVVSSGGNVAIGIGGTSNVAVFASSGQFVTGVTSASGNITGGNIRTAGTVTATGNVTANYLIGNGAQVNSVAAINITNSGGWSVTPSGSKLYFNFNGTNVGSLDSSGNFIVTGNVTAFGTP